MNETARHSFVVNVFGYELAHKVLPSTGPAMEGQNQGFLWVLIVHEARDGFHDDLRGDVLPEQLCLEVMLQPCAQENRPSSLIYKKIFTNLQNVPTQHLQCYHRNDSDHL